MVKALYSHIIWEITFDEAFSHINIGEKISFILFDVKITSYWLLVKKRIHLIHLVQIAQDLVQTAHKQTAHKF